MRFYHFSEIIRKIFGNFSNFFNFELRILVTFFHFFQKLKFWLQIFLTFFHFPRAGIRCELDLKNRKDQLLILILLVFKISLRSEIQVTSVPVTIGNFLTKNPNFHPKKRISKKPIFRGSKFFLKKNNISPPSLFVHRVRITHLLYMWTLYKGKKGGYKVCTPPGWPPLSL